MGLVYIYLFLCFFVDCICFNQILTFAQAIAFILIVMPNVVLMMLRYVRLLDY
jgi:hypothetical protein